MVGLAERGVREVICASLPPSKSPVFPPSLGEAAPSSCPQSVFHTGSQRSCPDAQSKPRHRSAANPAVAFHCHGDSRSRQNPCHPRLPAPLPHLHCSPQRSRHAGSSPCPTHTSAPPTRGLCTSARRGRPQRRRLVPHLPQPSAHTCLQRDLSLIPVRKAATSQPPAGGPPDVAAALSSAYHHRTRFLWICGFAVCLPPLELTHRTAEARPAVAVRPYLARSRDRVRPS